jgi:hypothetical protein
MTQECRFTNPTTLAGSQACRWAHGVLLLVLPTAILGSGFSTGDRGAEDAEK